MKDDVLINIGANTGNAKDKILGLLDLVKKRYGAVIELAKKAIDKTRELKLDAEIKRQKETLSSFSTVLDKIIKQYDMATYKSERLANAIRNETSASIQRMNAYRSMQSASYDMYRRSQVVPGMTTRQAFEKNASIDANQRKSDISYAERIQGENERAAKAEIDKIEADRKATEQKIARLTKLRSQVMLARDAIANPEDYKFNFSEGFASNARKARKQIDAYFGVFNPNGNASEFWDSPEIQNFKGSYSELSQKIGGMLRDAQKSMNALDDSLKASREGFDVLQRTGRGNIASMKENDKSITAANRRQYDYDTALANERRSASLADRARSVTRAEKEIEWQKRAETADRQGLRDIIEEKRKFYEELAEIERKELDKYLNMREEDLNEEDKWRRDRAESRLYSIQDTLRGIGEESRKFEKQGGDVDRFNFVAAQRDKQEAQSETARGLAMTGISGFAASIANGAHWSSKLSDVTGKLNKLAEKYGMKNGDFTTIDFRRLRANEYDSALFDRLQGKAETYRGNLSTAASSIIEARQGLAGKMAETYEYKNRLTAMGLGGGNATQDFGKDTANNTKKSAELLQDILSVLNVPGSSMSWGM